MIGFTRKVVGADGGGTALAALVVAAPVDLGSASCPAEPPRVRWLGLTTVSVAEATQGIPAAAPSERPGHGRRGPDSAGRQVRSTGSQSHLDRTGTLLVDLDLRNDSDETVHISAGQFRLRLGSAVSVSHQDARQPVTAVPPGRTVVTRIAYRVPSDAETVSLDFTPVGATQTRGLPLYPIRAQPA